MCGILNSLILGLDSLFSEQILMERRLFMSKGEDTGNPKDGSEVSRNKFYFPFLVLIWCSSQVIQYQMCDRRGWFCKDNGVESCHYNDKKRMNSYYIDEPCCSQLSLSGFMLWYLNSHMLSSCNTTQWLYYIDH